jgi:hypothetical protein
MKKLLLFSVAIILSLGQLLAQESTFKLGDKVLNLGIGLGSAYYSSYYTSQMPAFSASFEVAVADKIAEKGSIGVGGYIGFSSAKYTNYYNTSNFLIGARGSFHYPLVTKLDTYGGLILGYNAYRYNYDNAYSGPDISSSKFVLAPFVGARYYFNKKFAVMGEIGFNISYLTLGVSLKF